MEQSNKVRQKFFIAGILFTIAILGFMVKLPSVFRQMDKPLHALFYFCAAAFLSVMFVKRNLIKHIGVFMALLLFGIAIEWAQAYSNRFFRKRIHGRFDPQDVEANLVGLMAFSMLWMVCMAVILISKKIVRKSI